MFLKEKNNIKESPQLLAALEELESEDELVISKIDNLGRTKFEVLKRIHDLQDKGIHTIIYYPKPIHLQPAYKELGYPEKSLPNTEDLCDEVLSLPIFPEITIEQQNYIIESIIQLLKPA